MSTIEPRQLRLRSTTVNQKMEKKPVKRAALADKTKALGNNNQGGQDITKKGLKKDKPIAKATAPSKSIPLAVKNQNQPVRKPTETKKSKQEKDQNQPLPNQKPVAKVAPTNRKVLHPIEDNNEVAKNEQKAVKKQRTVQHDDLDVDDFNDPMMVAEYVDDIFDYLRDLEVQTLPNPDYMENQKELQWKMRAILIDWLIEVHGKFRLLPETLYLTVNIIDRFLSLRVVSLAKLQLVGLTCMFISAKYEEVISPSIQNFLYMAEDGYTEEEIIKAERYVLQVLKFGLQYPTPMSFLRRSSKADDYDIQTRTLAKYLMEVTLMDHKFLPYTSSIVAASSHYLARHMLNRGKWDDNLIHYSGYTEQELAEPTSLLLQYLSKPTKYTGLFKKYSQRKFMKGALFVKDWIETHSDGRLHPMEDHRMNLECRKREHVPEMPAFVSDEESDE